MARHQSATTRELSNTMKVLIFAFALIVTGCSDMQPSPVAPSPTSPAPPPPTTPSPVRQPQFGIELNANGGATFVGEPWQSTLVVTSSDVTLGPPSTVSVKCGASATEQIMGGFVGARIVSCTFPTTGTQQVTASVVAQNGVTTTTGVVISVTTRPAPPPPPPPPTPPQPAPNTLSLTVVCTAKPSDSATPCNVSGRMNDGTVVTSQLHDVHWDLGNGDTTVTPGPLLSYVYGHPGTYTVIASATHAGSTAEATTSVVIP